MKVDELLDLVCEVLRRDPGSLTLADTPDSVEEWDSVGHLSILATVDEALDVDVNVEALQSFKSIGELVDTLKSMGALEA